MATKLIDPHLESLLLSAAKITRDRNVPREELEVSLHDILNAIYPSNDASPRPITPAQSFEYRELLFHAKTAIMEAPESEQDNLFELLERLPTTESEEAYIRLLNFIDGAEALVVVPQYQYLSPAVQDILAQKGVMTEDIPVGENAGKHASLFGSKENLIWRCNTCVPEGQILRVQRRYLEKAGKTIQYAQLKVATRNPMYPPE
jgi:hypothetical protein